MAPSATPTSFSDMIKAHFESAGLGLMERFSLRPKTFVTAVPVLAGLGIGTLTIFNRVVPSIVNVDKPKKGEKPRLLFWDVFDPQGHRQINLDRETRRK